VVGSGGAGFTAAGGQVFGAGSRQGNDGGNSSFNNINAYGGGGGGAYWESQLGVTNGRPGGSGGGGGWNNNASTSGGSGNRITGSSTPAPTQGNDGGSGPTSTYTTHGGGGAGGVGGSSNGPTSGSGGPGIISNISGLSVYYGAGGGGGAQSLTAGLGGTGGGGNGSNNVNASGNSEGQNATGIGAGGGGMAISIGYAGSGGSGIVVVRYTTSSQTLNQPYSYTGLALNNSDGVRGAANGTPISASNGISQANVGGTATFPIGIPYSTLRVIYGDMANGNLGNKDGGAVLSINGSNVTSTATIGTDGYNAAYSKYYDASNGILNSIGISAGVSGSHQAFIFAIIVDGIKITATGPTWT
jgi:hypothetical protein